MSELTAEQVIEKIDRCTKPLVFFNREGYINQVLWKRVSENYYHKEFPFCTLIWDGEFIKVEHKMPTGKAAGIQTQVTYVPLDQLVALPSFLKAAFYYHRGLRLLKGERCRM